MTREQRFCRQHQARIQRRENLPPLLTGYAAVFYRADDPGTEYELWPGLRERVLPTAFDRAIREKQDVRGLVNHDSNRLLGRTAANTLRLSVDAIGLRYEIELPETSVGRDIALTVDRGDMSGSSFSFVPKRSNWVETDDMEIRELTDVDLYDVGPVTFPAYEATTAGMRAAGMEDLKREFEQRKAQRGLSGEDEIAVRLALLRLDGR